jgi:hypothetical protein
MVEHRQQERIMAKGQKRSSRETKKPKKSAAEKSKGGEMSPYKQQMQGASAVPTKKP